MMRKLNILVKRLVLWLNHTPLHICTLIVCSGVVIKAWVLFQNWVIWNFCCFANLSFLFHCDKFFFDLYFWFHFRNIFEYFRFSALIKNCVSLTLSFISCHIVPVLKKMLFAFSLCILCFLINFHICATVPDSGQLQNHIILLQEELDSVIARLFPPTTSPTFGKAQVVSCIGRLEPPTFLNLNVIVLRIVAHKHLEDSQQLIIWWGKIMNKES